MHATEVVLLDYLRAGDTRAFDECYTNYRKPLFVMAFTILQNEADAQDAVQELFIDLWEKKSYNNITGSLKSFLYTSIKNRCLNQLAKNDVRRKHLKNILPDAVETTSPHHLLENRQEKEELTAALQQLLHPQTFKVIELAYLQEKSRKEISLETGTSPNTIRNQLVNGIKTLRKNFKRR